MTPPTDSKICARSDIAARAARLPRPVVFTNGVFDLLHRGHVEYLAEARRLGGSLIVGVNGDGSARALNKGTGRPLNSAADRAAVLAALECVDLVVAFDEPTPARLLDELRPQVYVKGGDYSLDRLPEVALVSQWGASAVILGYREGSSTSQLIQRAHQATVQEKDTTP